MTGPSVQSSNPTDQEDAMLYWAAIFFIIAIIAGGLGFGGLAAAASGIAQILFYIFLVLFLVSLIAGLVGCGRRPPI
jgi:uncharacterized membrane protein YtjA (UPF0391 family)